MDELHRGLFATLLADKADFPAETVVDLTLLGRYYERFADHGVSVARRVVYLVTGEFQNESEVDHEEQEEARGETAAPPGASTALEQ